MHWRIFAVIAPLFIGSIALAGDLDPPPGPISETMKAIDVVEPRTPIGPDTTPGDLNALYVITESGSYYLTGDVVVGGAGQGGIRVEAPSVTIDLMGHTIRNVGSTGVNIGVNCTEPRAVIHNGGVTGWNDGVRVDSLSIVKNMRAWECGTGIRTGETCFVQSCVVEDCVAQGIISDNRSRVDSCTVTACGATGIDYGAFSLVKHCTSSHNGANGISTINIYSIVSDCVSEVNGASGVVLNNGLALRCISAENDLRGFKVGVLSRAIIRDCSAIANGENGIEVGSGSLVARNVLNRNGSDAIVTGDFCSVYENTLARNLSGITAFGTGCFIARNNVVEHEFGVGVNAVEPYARIVDNLCNENAFGIDAEGGSTIERNTVAQNFTGILVTGESSRISENNSEGNTAEGIVVTGKENLIERNRFSNNQTEGLQVTLERNLILRNINRFSVGAWDIVPDNRVAFIVIPPLSGTISGDSDPDANGAGTTDPWSNFSH